MGEEYGGQALLKLLAPKKGEQILDLGCGKGYLTARIADSDACVQGIDSCSSRIGEARDNYPQDNYPHIKFEVKDASNFPVEEPLDAVFSYSVLHLIEELNAVINCVERALKPGGRFVAEFNGKGSVEALVRALLSVLSKISGQEPEALNPWYCPSIGEYTGLLENQGFDVRYALLFVDRPVLLSGEYLETWIRGFVEEFLPGWSDNVQWSQVTKSVEECLPSALYCDGNGIAEHRIIRVLAIKNSSR
ncbi:MAG: class I SAM-dependent methyltransferase [Microcoleus sp. T1-bin1]|nr:class I SAM-dependent methyltransferase [Microcoleus sp. T1-bin1]